MGTRSRVGVMHGDVVKSVYCHYDGYLQHTGEMLHRYYDSVAANALVARGDNSGVQESVDEMNFYDEREQDGEDVKDFLESTPWLIAHSFEEFLEQVEDCWGEYYYIMKDGVWYCGCVYDTPALRKNTLVPLSEALAALAVAELTAEEE